MEPARRGGRATTCSARASSATRRPSTRCWCWWRCSAASSSSACGACSSAVLMSRVRRRAPPVRPSSPRGRARRTLATRRAGAARRSRRPPLAARSSRRSRAAALPSPSHAALCGHISPRPRSSLPRGEHPAGASCVPRRKAARERGTVTNRRTASGPRGVSASGARVASRCLVRVASRCLVRVASRWPGVGGSSLRQCPSLAAFPRDAQRLARKCLSTWRSRKEERLVICSRPRVPRFARPPSLNGLGSPWATGIRIIRLVAGSGCVAAWLRGCVAAWLRARCVNRSTSLSLAARRLNPPPGG